MKIVFEVQTDYGIYRDALYFSDDSPIPNDAAVEALKTERVQNWISFITAPPTENPEELLSESTDG
jgi:hypothetical protein